MQQNTTYCGYGGVIVNKKCSDCAKYTNNMSGAWAKKLCTADMGDNRIDWFVRKDPKAECHRPDDYEPLPGDSGCEW